MRWVERIGREASRPTIRRDGNRRDWGFLFWGENEVKLGGGGGVAVDEDVDAVGAGGVGAGAEVFEGLAFGDCGGGGGR